MKDDSKQLETIEMIRRLRRLEKRHRAKEAKVLRSKIVEANIPLVWFFINRMLKTHRLSMGLEPNDLLSHGVLALYHSVDKFDTERGVRFSTYARNWIVQYLWNAAKSTAVVRAPSKRWFDRTLVRLDAPTSADKGNLYDIFADDSDGPEEITAEKEKVATAEKVVQRTLSRLGDRFSQVVRMKIDNSEMGSVEVAKRLGVSKQRVNQIETRFMEEIGKTARRMAV